MHGLPTAGSVKEMNTIVQLTHLCRMELPTVMKWTSPFPILGLLGGIFHFYSNFKRNFCKQTVKNLIRRRHLVLHCLPVSHKKDARLIWAKQTRGPSCVALEPSPEALALEALLLTIVESFQQYKEQINQKLFVIILNLELCKEF